MKCTSEKLLESSLRLRAESVIVSKSFGNSAGPLSRTKSSLVTQPTENRSSRSNAISNYNI